MESWRSQIGLTFVYPGNCFWRMGLQSIPELAPSFHPDGFLSRSPIDERTSLAART